jgi:uncharacterized protein (UPF0262 family)
MRTCYKPFGLKGTAGAGAMDETSDKTEGNFRLVQIELDETAAGRASPDVEHERAVAIFDLLEDNYFAPTGAPNGPFSLYLSLAENRLVFDIRRPDGRELGRIMLSLSPFRRIIKDYFLVCESYFEAIKTSSPSRIEAIDMGRRGLHDEGSEFLRERLKGKIDLDINTARRLFTLIYVLHIRG